MGNWIYTSEIDKKLEKHREEVQNATQNLVGTTFNRVDDTIQAFGNILTRQVNTADKLIGNNVGKLDNVARYAVDSAVKGLDRSVTKIDKMTRHAVGTLNTRVELSINIINGMVNDSVKTIEDSFNKIDRRIKKHFKHFLIYSNFLLFCVL